MSGGVVVHEPSVARTASLQMQRKASSSVRKGRSGVWDAPTSGPKRTVWLRAEVDKLKEELVKVAGENHQLSQELAESANLIVRSSELLAMHEKQEHACDGDAVEAQPDPDQLEPETLDTNEQMKQVTSKMNTVVLLSSALGQSRSVQWTIYAIAFGGMVFVLLATAYGLGAHAVPCDDHAATTVDAQGDAHHRRLSGGVSELVKDLAFTTLGAGAVTFIAHVLRQPLILGFIIGGMLVGPRWLGIVCSHQDISDISELGLIFLLFMIGLELDLKELPKMPRATVVPGVLQFPICMALMFGVYRLLDATGFPLGEGHGLDYGAYYAAIAGALTSTTVVVKALAAKGESDSQTGRLSMSILIFQNIWAVVVIAAQPNIDVRPFSREVLNLLKTFGLLLLLLAIAFCYAKFVMPAVLHQCSKSTELMLVMSLAWLALSCSAAALPYVGLSLELAALIAGVALATFPYSMEFNTKIKYIRDYFITIYFASLGLQVPKPDWEILTKALTFVFFVLTIRWAGVYVPLYIARKDFRLAAVTTVNLSSIGELSLVITSMGVLEHQHINPKTLEVVIVSWIILAFLGSYMIAFNHWLYRGLVHVHALLKENCPRTVRSGAARSGAPVPGVPMPMTPTGSAEGEDGGDADDEEEHEILVLGFHKVAFMLVAEFQTKTPQLLKHLHVIGFNKTIMPRLRSLGIKCTYGDISSEAFLRKVAQTTQPRIVVSSIPDIMLQGVTNATLVKLTKRVWPDAHVIATADSPQQAQVLYDEHADYVVRMAKLCAERLFELLNDHCTAPLGHGELEDLFQRYKVKDKDLRSVSKSFLHDIMPG